jgi:hypothetical protein
MLHFARSKAESLASFDLFAGATARFFEAVNGDGVNNAAHHDVGALFASRNSARGEHVLFAAVVLPEQLGRLTNRPLYAGRCDCRHFGLHEPGAG